MKRSAVVVVLLCFAVLGASQTPKDKGIPKQNGTLDSFPASKTKSERQDTATPPNQTIAIYDQPSRTDHSGDNKQGGDAIDIERKLTKFTGYLVIVGLLQFVILAVQALLFFQQKRIMGEHKVSLEQLANAANNNVTAIQTQAGIMDKQLASLDGQIIAIENQNSTMKESVAVARESATAANTSADAYMISKRAQLIAVIQGQIQGFAIGEQPVVPIEIKNTGVTPAYHCLYETWIEVLDVPFVDFTAGADYFKSPFPTTVYPNSPAPVIVFLALQHAFTLQEFLEFPPGHKSLCVRVRIEYEDAYKKKRWSEFGYEFTGQRVGAFPKYNDAN